MQIYGALSGFAYCIAALIVAVRLLRLARRTGQLPELMIGTSFMTGSVIGYPALLASRLLIGGSPSLAWPFAATGLIGVSVATLCMLVAWWRIYHPTRRWGPWVVGAWSGLILVCLVLELRLPAAEFTAFDGSWLPVRLIVQGGAFAVMAWSGFRYHARLRRRMRVLLTDPVVANRILLWSIAAGGVTLQCSYILAIPLLNGFFDAEAAAPVFYGTLGLIVALCITQAFYPTQVYMRNVRKRTGLEVG